MTLLDPWQWLFHWRITIWGHWRTCYQFRDNPPQACSDSLLTNTVIVRHAVSWFSALTERSVRNGNVGVVIAVNQNQTAIENMLQSVFCFWLVNVWPEESLVLHQMSSSILVISHMSVLWSLFSIFFPLPPPLLHFWHCVTYIWLTDVWNVLQRWLTPCKNLFFTWSKWVKKIWLSPECLPPSSPSLCSVSLMRSSPQVLSLYHTLPCYRPSKLTCARYLL